MEKVKGETSEAITIILYSTALYFSSGMHSMVYIR